MHNIALAIAYEALYQAETAMLKNGYTRVEYVTVLQSDEYMADDLFHYHISARGHK